MLGARIASLRREAGMSQAELAKRLSVSTSTVGMYEQGRREPSGDRIVALARLFDVTTDYLLTGLPVSKKDESALVRTFRSSFHAADGRLQQRSDAQGDRPLSRQELAVLFAALLSEP